MPDRWEKYSNIGCRIPQTKFICFKVPLEGLIHTNVVRKFGSSQQFRIPDLLEAVWQQEEQQLGLVIDLTATDRYYNPAELTSKGVEHTKVTCPGAYDRLKDLPPPDDVYIEFSRTVVSFELDHKADDFLIGVHCTHGVNRTGYLICRFMIEEMGYSAEEAIEQFSLARGHQIEKLPYLNDLKVKANHLARADRKRNRVGTSKETIQL